MSLIDRSKRALPSVITLAGLMCGLIVVLLGVELDGDGPPVTQVMLLLGAVIFDLLDGATARALGVQSAFGRELDSLSDLVCFGVAPATLLHHALAPTLGGAALLPAALIALAAAVRLARFNVWSEQPRADLRRSVGLTVPTGASACSSGLLLGPALVPPLALAALAIMLAALMVSTVPYRTTKGLRASAATVTVFGVIAAAALTILLTAGISAALAALALGYAASGPIEWAWHRLTPHGPFAGTGKKSEVTSDPRAVS